MKAWWITLASVALLGGGVVTLLPSAPDTADGSDDEAMVMVGREHNDGTVRFTIEGRTVRGLYPGAVKQMRTTVVNPSRHRLRVQKLDGKVVSTSRRSCPIRNLQVRPYDGKLPQFIEPYERVTLSGALPVAMPPDAPSKCAGVRFTIALSGVGRQEGR